MSNFTCPRCRSHSFGTSNCNSDKSQWVGHCHGKAGLAGCGFTWHRQTEDHKVGLVEKPMMTDEQRGWLAYRLTQRLTIDIATARAAVDAALDQA